MESDLSRLRELLDRHVVGHEEAKDALLLGLVCREHIYLEGPPGTAKTRMAEVSARGSSLEFFFYQFHRDTRTHELLGDVDPRVVAEEGGHVGAEGHPPRAGERRAVDHELRLLGASSITT